MARYYYFIKAFDPATGKPYLIKGDYTEDGARQKGLQMLQGIDFEIVAYPTTNLSTASRMMKGGRLEATRNLHKSVERIGHEKTVQRRQGAPASRMTPEQSLWLEE